MIYLTSTNETAIDNLITTQNINLGLPNQYGTTTLATKEKATNSQLWFVPKVTFWAGNNNEGFPQEIIMNGVDMTDITEVDCQLSDFIPEV